MLPRKGTVNVSAAPHPLKVETIDTSVPEGLTVLEILKIVQPDEVLLQHAYVEIDGFPIPSDKWHLVRPKAGRMVCVRIAPSGGGGGGGGKSPLRILAMVAVIAMSFYMGPLVGQALLGGELGGSVAIGGALVSTASIGTALVSITGMLLVNAIFPVRPPSLPTGNNSGGVQEASKQFLEGARNTADVWGVVPTLFGKHKLVPPLGAKTYTEVVGDDQYLKVIIIWGHGPLEIGEPSIDSTLLSQFEDVQVETRQGYPGDAPFTLYPAAVDEKPLAILVDVPTGLVIRESEADADSLSIDITFAQGLVAYDTQGNKGAVSVTLQIMYRKLGDTAWLAPSFTQTTAPADWIANVGSAVNVTFTSARTAAIRHGFRWNVGTRGTYEVAVQRLTADSTSEQTFDKATWSALRTITNEHPINYPKPLAMTALSIRATNQLTGSLGQVSATCTSILPDWDSATQTWITRTTQNPAAHFRAALQGPGVAIPFSDTEINLAELQDWADYCNANGLQFNQNRNFDASLWDTLADIAAAGRAAPTNKDGLWTVVIDRPQDFPVQHFTPRNTRNFSYEKAFTKLPDGFRVQFLNETQDYGSDEMLVFADGFTKDNASVYEQIQFPGVTHPDQIYKHGRWRIKELELRPERYTVDVDFEHLVARRGDLSLLTHDVILVGLASGRIKDVVRHGGLITHIRIDEEVTMEEGNQYAVSVRTVDNAELVLYVVIQAGTTTLLQLETPYSGGVEPSIGDLFSFGVRGLATMRCLVQNIQRATDFGGKVTLVPYSPAIYDAPGASIPPFVTSITPLKPIPAPANITVVSDESVLERKVGTTLLVRAVVSADPLMGFDSPVLEVQARSSVSREPYHSVSVVRTLPNGFVLGNVQQGEVLDFRLRWNVNNRLPGPWAEKSNVLIVGKTTPPSALANMTISVFGGQAYIRWDDPPEIDVRIGGTVIFRFTEELVDPLWSDSTSIGDIFSAASRLATLPLKQGSYLARVRDQDGFVSPVVYVTTKQASVLAYANVSTIAEDPTFAGTRVNVVSGTATDRVTEASDDRLTESGDTRVIEGAVTGGPFIMLADGAFTGTYTFANGFDFLSVSRVRLTVTLTAASVNVSALIDDYLSNIDTLEDFDGTQQAQSDAKVYVRHTDDDPAGTPTWTPWERLDSAEFQARGFQFKIEMSTDDLAYNILVSALGVRADNVP